MDRLKKGEGQQFRRQPKKPGLSLRCLINHDAMTFVVESDPDWEVGDLKPVIHARAVHGILRDTDSKDIVLCKVSNVFGCNNTSTNLCLIRSISTSTTKTRNHLQL
jgi:hypothetical protein